MRSLRSFLVPALGLLFAGAVVSAAAATYPNTVLADQPAGYWRLGETPPNPVPELTAANRGSAGPEADGAYLGGVALRQPGALAAQTGTAASFDGGNDRLDVPFTTALNPAGAFTVEAWVRLRGGSGNRAPLSSQSATGGQKGYLFTTSGNTWQFRTFNGTTANTVAGPTAQTNAWTHLVGVYDGTATHFFVNGAEVGTPVTAACVPNETAVFRLGAAGTDTAPASWWPGLIDEVAVYPKALSAARIKEHFDTASANGAAYPDLVLADAPAGYWRLDETRDPVAKNSGSLGERADGVFFDGLNASAEGAVVGDGNGAVTFDKSAQSKIEIPFQAELNQRAFTIECWTRVDPDSGDYRSPVTARDDFPLGTTRGYILYATPGNRWEFWTGTGGQWHSLDGGPVNPGGWTHLVGTYDGTNKTFYVDGVLVGVNTAPVAMQLNGLRVVRIGGGQTDSPVGSFFFAGEVDEVAIYPAVLSADRVAAHYLAARGENPPAVAPTIARQPKAQSVFDGTAVTLSVAALGTPPFTYAWTRDGQPVPGATDAVLTFPKVTVANAGSYVVEVRNAAGNTTSTAAVLTVKTQPAAIAESPRALTRLAGADAVFTVTATGSSPLAYQWRSNRVDIPGGTNATLMLPNVQTTFSADYAVQVTNAGGSAESAAARLSVLPVAKSSYVAGVMADHPTAYWQLDEGSGPTAFDYAGGFDGTYAPGVSLAQPGALVGVANRSALFDGSGGKVHIPYSAVLNPAGAFSLEAWARVAANGTPQPVLSSRDDVSGAWRYGYALYAGDDGSWQFWTGMQTAGWHRIAGPEITADEWVHLVATYEDGTKTLYVNGEAVASAGLAPYTANGDPTAGTARGLGLGGSADDDPLAAEYFAGLLDEVAVYPTALAPARVQEHYLLGTGRYAPPPTLTIQRLPAALMVRWSLGVQGYTLESTTDLTAGSWTAVPGVVNNSVTITPTGLGTYYRLRK